MAIPNDGTPSYPQDSMGRPGAGVWSSASGAYFAPRGTSEGAANVIPNGRRASGVHHRAGVLYSDKIQQPTVGTATGQVSGGSLVATTSYNWGVAAATIYGPSLVTLGAAATPGTGNNGLRLPITQVPNAAYYDLFLSTDASPRWVARVTEAQRASGGIITSVGGTLGVGGAANSVDIGVVGTGVASNAAPFSVSNGYVFSGAIAPVPCVGYSVARVLVAVSVSDLRSTPILSLLPFFQNQQTPTQYHAGSLITVPLLSNAGQPLIQDFELSVKGSSGLIIVVDTIIGSGISVDVWVELS